MCWLRSAQLIRIWWNIFFVARQDWEEKESPKSFELWTHRDLIVCEDCSSDAYLFLACLGFGFKIEVGKDCEVIIVVIMEN